MASGFFALLDDIAALMDDVATMSKVAAKKTAGILGDDLAVNAEKSSGFVSSREIPVLWAITKGSFINKLIILPVAFLLSAFLPSAITVILVIGGLYLAYEGAEKIFEFFVPQFEFFVPHADRHIPILNQKLSEKEILSIEKEKIKSAIITDFILSVEIIIIALGTVVQEGIGIQIMVTTIIAIIATVGVYGVVALIVRMDEFGAKLIAINDRPNSLSDIIGRTLVQALPYIIKSLSVIGTIALILVAGGIFVHEFYFLHNLFQSLPSILINFIVGFAAGTLTLVVVNSLKVLRRRMSK